MRKQLRSLIGSKVRTIRSVPANLKALVDKRLGFDIQRETAALAQRSATSSDEMAAILEQVYAQRPELHAAFADGPTSDDFWAWANTEGLFEHDELRFCLAPIPPFRLIRCFSYEKTEQQFAWTGTLHYSIFQRLLKKHGLSFNRMSAVLDFGCGAGRLGRLFARGSGKQRYIGCDLVAPSIRNLQRTMNFGEFHIGFLSPSLPFADASLDAVFSLSVFTHLSETAMHGWLAEFHRVLRPGGIVIQTTLGRKAMFMCTSTPFGWRKTVAVGDEDFAGLKRQFEDRGFGWAPHNIPVGGGDSYGIAFQTEQYIARDWTRHFQLLEVAPAAIDDWQDVVLLRKPMKQDAPCQPILPTWPPSDLPGPERVEIQAPKQEKVGTSVNIQATAVGGTDVHYRFSIQTVNSIVPPFRTDWQREPVTTWYPTRPGLARLTVEAASGAGYHYAAQASASADLIVHPPLAT